jgi:hypothetical protein
MIHKRMPNFKPLYFLVTFSCLMMNAVFAQEAEGGIELQFVSFPKSLDAKPVELLIGEGKTILVELPTNSISQIYKVKPQANWKIGKMVKDDEGKPSFQVYGEAPAIRATKQLILVIRSAKDDADGLKLIPMDYSESNFGGGNYFVMNASGVDIAGAIGTSKFTLQPRKHTLLAPKPTKTVNDRDYCFAKFFYRVEENVQPFFSSTWRFNKAARSMVFFYQNGKTKHLRIHTIRSYVK